MITRRALFGALGALPIVGKIAKLPQPRYVSHIHDETILATEPLGMPGEYVIHFTEEEMRGDTLILWLDSGQVVRKFA